MTRDQHFADQTRLQQLLPQAEEILMKIPGVVGVGIGIKRTDNELTETTAYRVYVQRKKPTDDVPPDQQIPEEVLGVPTDVIEMVITTSSVDTAEYRPVKGGIQIGNGSGAVGTLGCMAIRTSDSAKVLLSNHHVMMAGGKVVGDKIGQPDYCESCCCSCGEVGTIAKGEIGGLVDCAIAVLKGDITSVNQINQIGDTAGKAVAIKTETVRKTGRTTGFTTGIVEDINFPTRNEKGTVFNGQLLISPVAGIAKFSDSGDSGSAIVNAGNQVVGLLWGSNVLGTVASHIDPVLTAMGITIPAGSNPVNAFREIASLEPPSETAVLVRRLERSLRQTEPGQAILNVIQEFRSEVMQLINHNRAVGVAWQRRQGPAFVAALFRSVKESTYRIPREIEGVSVRSLLMGMATVLDEHGSFRLREAISQHVMTILEAADKHDTIEGMLSQLAVGSEQLQ